jgi:hypothetical protein
MSLKTGTSSVLTEHDAFMNNINEGEFNLSLKRLQLDPHLNEKFKELRKEPPLAACKR